ncbi:MAG: valine--tRNA ligase, partial [Ureaplasma sp.]|nr:valine--tRNA ligase [Ureaplasma sp.]
MKKEIDKKYNHLKVESDKYNFWLSHNLFNPKLFTNKKSFSIILPPPNVTGHLHLGHAWDTSYQDMLIRYKKLRGYNTFWVPGTDHAGIATQTKFEKHLKETENLTRDEIGREKFLDKLWDWKESQANFIRSQWKKLGLSLAYKYEKFTMDADVNLAVNKVFVDLFKKGLIYQKKKIVNWDPILKTAISNIEVVYKTTKSKMYYLKYWTENKSEYIIVATTRPETMFGDVCLVANPDDERYLKYKNTKFINPANNELLPIIYDDYIDKEFGTGIMKCTPAHDFNDNELAIKHNLEFINILNENGTMNEIANEYNGFDRFECRNKLIEKLQQQNLVEKIEDIENNIGYSERTNVIVEPYMSNQWFVKMKPLADEIIKIQNSNNKVEFVPNRFNNTLLTWLENIDDWCISRQLWWGHQIPIWYNKHNNEIYCDVKEPIDKENWVRDESVLDTWFSSGLWPLVTLNWPNTNNKIFKKFFPTDVLVTGYDIIFFWVSRMLTMSQENQNSIPFKEVLIHGLIRDEQGRKMSKSLGNGIDPMDVIDEYGADSLRLFLTSSSTLGEDLNYSNTKVASNWNFLNKLWNGYRYISQLIDNHNFKMNLKIKPEKLSIIDYYILSSLNEMIKNVTHN